MKFCTFHLASSSILIFIYLLSLPGVLFHPAIALSNYMGQLWYMQQITGCFKCGTIKKKTDAKRWNCTCQGATWCRVLLFHLPHNKLYVCLLLSLCLANEKEKEHEPVDKAALIMLLKRQVLPDGPNNRWWAF